MGSFSPKQRQKNPLRFMLISVSLFLLLTTAWIFQGNATLDEDISDINVGINKKKEEVDQIRERIKAHEGQLKALQGKAVTLENQIQILDNHIARTELDIKLLEVQIAQTNLEIEQINFHIEETKASIGDEKKKLGMMLQAIHQEDQRDLLEILLTNDSLNEFFDQIAAMDNIQADIKGTVDELKVVKYNLEQNEALLETKKLSLEKNQHALEDKQDLLEGNRNAKRLLLADTRQSESRFESLVDQLKAEQNSVNADIKELESSLRRKLEEGKIKNLSALGPARLDWPVPSRYVTTNWMDEHYPFNYIMQHAAIDIRAQQGTPVRAAETGFVGRARYCNSSTCYAYVMLIHNDGLATVYGHLSQIFVQEDDVVTKGNIIGLSGGTPGTVGAGRLTTAQHLHFEVRLNGLPVNPLNYLP